MITDPAIRRARAFRVHDSAIPEPLIYVRKLQPGDVMLINGFEREVRRLKRVGEFYLIDFLNDFSTTISGSILVRLARFSGEKK